MPGKCRGERGVLGLEKSGGSPPQNKIGKNKSGISDERPEARPVVEESSGPCYHLPWLALSSPGRENQTF